MTTFVLLDERICAALIGAFASAGHELVACVGQPETGIRFRVELDARETEWIAGTVRAAVQVER